MRVDNTSSITRDLDIEGISLTANFQLKKIPLRFYSICLSLPVRSVIKSSIEIEITLCKQDSESNFLGGVHFLFWRQI